GAMARSVSAGASGGGGSGLDARPFPQIPLTTKQLLMAGGGLLALIILIAVVAGGGDDTKSTKKVATGAGGAAGKVEGKQTAAEGPSAAIERGKELIASEDYEAAASLLSSARKAHPDHAELAFLAGKAYFGKLWWSDGIEHFRA